MESVLEEKELIETDLLFLLPTKPRPVYRENIRNNTGNPGDVHDVSGDVPEADYTTSDPLKTTFGKFKQECLFFVENVWQPINK